MEETSSSIKTTKNSKPEKVDLGVAIMSLGDNIKHGMMNGGGDSGINKKGLLAVKGCFGHPSSILELKQPRPTQPRMLLCCFGLFISNKEQINLTLFDSVKIRYKI
jgi:hypothetical protein